jgi:glutamate/aspartate transport system permease protein
LEGGAELSVDLGVITRNLEFMLGGLVVTFELAAISVLGGFLAGIALCLARLSPRRWLYVPATVYVNMFRSLPLLLVIFWFYFLVPIIIGRPLGDFFSASVAFIAFEAAYFAEIIRAGIQSVSRGQIEAGYSTGLSYSRIMISIVLPQALANMVPALVTQCVIIFQDSSLAYVIGLKEFLRRVSILDMREFRSVELYLFAAAVYLLLCSTGAALSHVMEKRQRAHGGRLGGRARRRPLGVRVP